MTYEADMPLPRLGDGDNGGRVVAWLKQPGEKYNRQDTLLEVETDKAIVEVPALEDGVLLEQKVSVDDIVDFQDVIARVLLEGEPPVEEELAADESALVQAAGQMGQGDSNKNNEAQASKAVFGENNSSVRSDQRTIASPFARKLARERSVVLANLTGTGKGGRIVGRDVLSRSVAGTQRLLSMPVLPVTTEEFSLEVSDGSVFCRSWKPSEQRSRETVVLLHGLFADVDAWAATASTVARQGVPVYALDLPCHGRTTNAATSFHEVVDIAAMAMAKLCLSNTLLVGHSYGAAVAVSAAGKLHDFIAKLILLAPLGVGSRIDQGFLDGMVYAESTAVLRREIGKLSASAAPPGDDFLQTMLERLSTRSPDLSRMVNSVARSGVQQINIHELLANLPVPVDILVGKCDAIMPWHEFLDIPPSVGLHLFKQAGHMPQWDAGAMTARLILDSMMVDRGKA